jgi:hypothetical protein
MYRFKNDNGCVTYQKGICGDEGTLMFIVETPGSFNEVLERDIIQFGNLRVNMKWEDDHFKLSSNSGVHVKLDPFKSYMCILRWSHNNYTISMNVYNYVHRDDVPIYKLRPEMYWFDFENPICSETAQFDDDLCMQYEMPCQIHAYPLQLTNIKYYNSYLDDKTITIESVKYTTDHKNCVINDLSRQIFSGHGYAVK